MKLRSSAAFFSALLFFTPFAPAIAQDAPAPPPQPGEKHAGRPERGRLSPEEREKLKAAREKAFQDEEVKAARVKLDAASADLREVLHPALLAQDGSLGPILDKMEAAAKQRGDHGPGARPPGNGIAGRGPMGVLTDEEREKLLAAREKIKDRPEIKAAHERQRTARKEFQEILRAAMLAADPSVESLLNERDMDGPGKHRRTGGPGGEKRHGGEKPPKPE